MSCLAKGIGSWEQSESNCRSKRYLAKRFDGTLSQGLESNMLEENTGEYYRWARYFHGSLNLDKEKKVTDGINQKREKSYVLHAYR